MVIYFNDNMDKVKVLCSDDNAQAKIYLIDSIKQL
jgi:hypothetical protein